MRQALFALLLCAVAGCASSAHSLTFVVREVRTEKCRVIIATDKDDVAATDLAVIMDALICLPDEVLLAPGIRFEITENQAHLGTAWNGYQAIGHHTVCPYDHICLTPKMTQGTVWHEMAHFYEAYLNRTQQPFVREWKAIAEGTYSTSSPYTSPSEGIVTAYGRGNYQEDIAEWVEEIYKRTRLHQDNFTKIKDRVTDPRYRKKLDLLYKYHLINTIDYNMMRPYFVYEK